MLDTMDITLQMLKNDKKKRKNNKITIDKLQ